MDGRLARIEAVLFDALTFLDSGQHRPALTSEREEQIVAPARRLMERGGKRWRALFMQLACEMHGGGDRALPLTPLVELTHAGSLIIDDIEDGARTRRGGPAAHVEFGVDLAVNAGNLAYFLPTRLLDPPRGDAAALDTGEALRVYRMYAATMRKLHYGQGLDILWHRPGAASPSADDYLSMCRLKSGSLAGLALGLGAALGGAGPAAVTGLVTIGERFGASFQIVDDVTNLELGNPGKDRGDDLVEGKNRRGADAAVAHLSLIQPLRRDRRRDRAGRLRPPRKRCRSVQRSRRLRGRPHRRRAAGQRHRPQPPFRRRPPQLHRRRRHVDVGERLALLVRLPRHGVA